MKEIQALKRLGLDLQEFGREAVPVRDILAMEACNCSGIGASDMQALKDEVYGRMLEYVQIEGYPMEGNVKEVNVNDLVLYILGPIIFSFQKASKRRVRLRREMEIISSDYETGVYEEFVVIDRISTTDHVMVFIIESKSTTVGLSIRKCLLAMFDMLKHSGKGKAYGFVTTGEQWRMIVYDGTRFRMTETFFALFGAMDSNKDRWMRECSVVVECVLFALNNGGVVDSKGVSVKEIEFQL